MQKSQKELSTLDINSFDEMDPSLSEGHRPLFDKEVPFELRIPQSANNSADLGTIENIRVKVLLLGEEDSPQEFKIQLTSDTDLFFNYMHITDEHHYRELQEEQKFTVNYSEFGAMIIRMMNSAIKQPNVFLCVLMLQKDGTARLDLLQNIDYKFIELLSLDFYASGEDSVRQQITYRYNLTRALYNQTQAKLKQISSSLKAKNPSLLMQIQKSIHK